MTYWRAIMLARHPRMLPEVLTQYGAGVPCRSLQTAADRGRKIPYVVSGQRPCAAHHGIVNNNENTMAKQPSRPRRQTGGVTKLLISLSKRKPSPLMQCSRRSRGNNQKTIEQQSETRRPGTQGRQARTMGGARAEVPSSCKSLLIPTADAALAARRRGACILVACRSLLIQLRDDMGARAYFQQPHHAI